MSTDDFVVRRTLLQAAMAAGATAGLSSLFGTDAFAGGFTAGSAPDEVDYVVIGSGPGGSPVAANLAEAGYRVLVLEAGPPAGNQTRYEVPAYWARASNDPAVQWDFYVRHYTDRASHGKQFIPEKDGILYPRIATLGGCTAHNALFTVYPEHSDWDYIQQLTHDKGWHPDRMWRHWERVQGWQSIEQPTPTKGPFDAQISALIEAAIADELPPGNQKTTESPNDRGNVDASAQGFYVAPQSQRNGHRTGARERLLGAAQKQPHNLAIATNALVERIVFEKAPDGRQRAVAVEYLDGAYLYNASPQYRPTSVAERRQRRRSVRVRKEVIVAGGVYNSPQILMLSGIGPAQHLQRHGIPVRVDLPGVGTNLQDRVEACLVNEYEQELAYLADCNFSDANDPCLTEFERFGADARYASNGSAAWIKRRYSQGSSRSELAVFGLPLHFEGYVPNFDQIAVQRPRRHWTWVVLKGFTQGRAGYVRLKSNDPTQMPFVNKRSLGDGTGGDYDIAAVKEGIGVARRISRKAGGKYRELTPGPSADLGSFIRREQFGHHAACSNPIGAHGDRMAVLDGQLRVRGTHNVRVVDASSFPKIPGIFIWAPIAILAEKASRDILADAERHFGRASHARHGLDSSLA